MAQTRDLQPLVTLDPGDVEVTTLTDRGRRLAFYVTPLGAPSAVAYMEELVALGVTSFVVIGSCGVLDAGVLASDLIVPTAAYRDEGTSYHYAPASDWAEVTTSGQTQAWLRELGVQFVAGKVWTTDAFYRETRAVMERRVAQGCIAVDMECSALAAASQWRGVDLYQFFYPADNLDADTWDPRGGAQTRGELRLAHMRIAIEFAQRIMDRS